MVLCRGERPRLDPPPSWRVHLTGAAPLSCCCSWQAEVLWEPAMVMLPAGWSMGGSVGLALLGVAVVATGLLVLRIVLGEEEGVPVCMDESGLRR